MATTAAAKKKRRKKKKRARALRRIIFVLLLIMIALIVAICVINKKNKDRPEETDESTVATSDADETADPIETTDETTAETDETTVPPDYPDAKDMMLDERLTAALSKANTSYRCNTIFVYDMKTEYMLYEQETKVVLQPASVTKLWVALYAQTLLEPDTVINVGDEVKLIKKGSTTAYMKSGVHSLTVEQLIAGMILPSGNDAAYVLAAAIGRDLAKNPDLEPAQAIEYFVIGINKYVEKIGCNGTTFTCPDGNTDEPEHHTTVHDLILVSELALKDEIISKYAKLSSKKVKYASGQSNTWNNTNLLLNPDNAKYYTPYAVGLKTGSLDGVYNLIAAASLEEGGEPRFIIGCFGESKNDRFVDAKLIIDTIVETSK